MASESHQNQIRKTRFRFSEKLGSVSTVWSVGAAVNPRFIVKVLNLRSRESSGENLIDKANSVHRKGSEKTRFLRNGDILAESLSFC